ncbi:MAG: hypothetical protein JW910_21050 [Anaerolineae bacterium]|nr:hypothetical protein [Anaerolineae bacterium]
MRQRATRALITDAFFRWESALTIALTMLLVFFVPTPFTWWHPLFWVIGGVLAELALIVTHINDPVAAEQAIARMFQEDYDPREIKNVVTREQFERALEYRAGIATMVAQHDGAMRVSMQETLSEIDDWIAQIFRLAKRMDVFDEDAILEQDRKAVPSQLRNLRKRMDLEEDPSVRAELTDAIRLKEQQLENLRAVANNVKRADIQLQNTLAALGTVYAQMQVIDTKDLDSARTRRLRDEIHDEVSGLQDTIMAMEEVYTYSASSRLRE